MTYADYIYYKNTYKGTMAEEDYNRISRQASAYIDNITFNRASKEQTESVGLKIKDACCAISDLMLKKENGGEIVSQTVGPWTKNFASSGKTMEQQIYESAKLYLGMTGLLCQGVAY